MELTGCDILAHCWRTYDAFWLPWSSRYHKSYHAVSCSGSKRVKRTTNQRTEPHWDVRT